MANTANSDHSSNVRLAESEAVAVDMCGCGTLQVHLGDLSLRLPAEMVANLIRTLGAALAARQRILAHRAAPELAAANWSGSETPRGKA